MIQRRLLYLGLDPSNYQTTDLIVHFPFIQIIPLPLEKVKDSLANFSLFTHVVITSKSTIPLLLNYLKILKFGLEAWENKKIIVVGKATAKSLIDSGLKPTVVAKNETSEGIVSELECMSLDQAHFFWPHSQLSRPIIRNFLQERKIKFTECSLYTTETQTLLKRTSLQEFDGIIFTSPSTVDAFLHIFGSFPHDKELIAIGPITEHYLILASQKAKVRNQV